MTGKISLGKCILSGSLKFDVKG